MKKTNVEILNEKEKLKEKQQFWEERQSGFQNRLDDYDL